MKGFIRSSFHKDSQGKQVVSYALLLKEGCLARYPFFVLSSSAKLLVWKTTIMFASRGLAIFSESYRTIMVGHLSMVLHGITFGGKKH